MRHPGVRELVARRQRDAGNRPGPLGPRSLRLELVECIAQRLLVLGPETRVEQVVDTRLDDPVRIDQRP